MILSWLVGAMLLGEPAQVVLDRVEQALADDRHDDAIRMMLADFEERGDARALYILGEIELDRGGCEAAIEYYGRFLASEPTEADVAQTRERLRLCGEGDGPEVPTPATPQPASPVEDEVVPAPPPPRLHGEVQLDEGRISAPRHWVADPVGAPLFFGGLAVAVGGAGFYGAAAADRDRAEAADNLERYTELEGRPVALSRAGIALLAVGGALTAAGIIVYSVKAKRRRQPAQEATFAVRF